VKGLPIIQTIPLTEIITVQNKNIQTPGVKFLLSVVFHSIYWKGGCFWTLFWKHP
jgi:hypothetical protein